MQSMICGYCTRPLIRGVRIRVHPPSLILFLIIARCSVVFNYTICIFCFWIYNKLFGCVTSAQKLQRKSAMINPYRARNRRSVLGQRNWRRFPKKSVWPAGAALKACPRKAISIPRGVYAVIDPELCVGCGLCAKKCPADVISMISREVAI